jgi:enoyl-CoA hydratase
MSFNMNEVLTETVDGIRLLILNRPEKLNSLTVGVFTELWNALQAIETDERIRCVVLKGAGRCFSAGHDLTDIAAGEKLPFANFQARVIERLSNLPMPVVSAVHGHCYTGALELALAGDIILAASDAKFADTHAKWAFTPVWGLTQRLPRRVGWGKAREMIFTCRTYSGAEATAMGLATACLPAEGFDAAVLEYCRSILANSSFSHRVHKRLLNESDGLPLAAGLAREVYREDFHGPDMAERIAAFAARKELSKV